MLEYEKRYGRYLDHGGKTSQQWLVAFRSDPQSVVEAIDAWQLTAAEILASIEDTEKLNDRQYLDIPSWFDNLTRILTLWADTELRIDPMPLCDFNSEVQGYRSRNVIVPDGKVIKVDPPVSLERAEGLFMRARVVLERTLSIGQQPANKPAAGIVALTPEEKTILETLAVEQPMTVTQEELAAGTRLSERTVRKYLAALRNRNLCDQPRGNRKGFGITQSGLSALGR